MRTPDPAMKPSIRGTDLVRVFGAGDLRTYALKEVSLEIEAGKMTVLMGPSGSGKSTLLAILSGLLRPSSGEVLTLNENLWGMSESQREAFRRRHCGFIFQGYNLFPALSARQQLEIVLNWGEGVGGREARNIADRALSDLGLGAKSHLRPSQLSGGEQQRVAVARALVKNPNLIFADEPTAALDWKHGEQVIRMLRDAAHSRSATVLVVSHDPRVGPLADRVLHLEDGRLHSDASQPMDSEPRPGAALVPQLV